MSSETRFLAHRWSWLILLCPHLEDGGGALWGPSIRALTPSWGPTLMTSSPPRGPTSRHHHLGVRFQHTILGGRNTQAAAPTPMCEALG